MAKRRTTRIKPTDTIRAAAVNMSKREVRFLIETHQKCLAVYQSTKSRANFLHKESQSNENIKYVYKSIFGMRNDIAGFLGLWVENHPAAKYFKDNINGIGPFIAAGLAAYIDIDKCKNHYSSVWFYAGLTPNSRPPLQKEADKIIQAALDEFEKKHGDNAHKDHIRFIANALGRPYEKMLKFCSRRAGPLTWRRIYGAIVHPQYCVALKLLCNSLGNDIIKKKSFYQDLYKYRHSYETTNNKNLAYKKLATSQLERFDFDPKKVAYKAYVQGKLPPGHINARAKHWAVKILLCYSADTYVWTTLGPQRIVDLTKDSLVLTLNPITHKLEYQQPTKLYKYAYDGKLAHFSGEGYNQLVTPNHQMWVRHRDTKKWRFVAAQDIVEEKRSWAINGRERFRPDCWEFMLGNADWDGVLIKHENLDTWCELLGWFLSEGHTYKPPNHPGGYTIGISQKSEVVKEHICNLFTRLGYKPRKYDNIVVVSSKKLFPTFEQFGKSYQKFIPKEMKSLPTQQLNILFEALISGDGERKPNGIPKRYTTVSKQLSFDVMEIALKLGYGVRCRERRQPPHRIAYVVTFFKEHNTPRVNAPRTVAYKGFVHCLEVPNHLVLAGREGKYSWCGNSHYYQIEYYIQHGEAPPDVYALDILKGHRKIHVPGDWKTYFKELRKNGG